MKKLLIVLTAITLGIALMAFPGCAKKNASSGIDTTSVVEQALKGQEANLKNNLAKFDTLDFVVFSNQQWMRLHESHSSDVIVNWPDGHNTKGLAKHIEDLKAMFVYAPDTRVKEHPIRFGDQVGDWTCVTGVFEGTFTKPMPIGNGKSIQPTGKAFKLPMCTVGHWKNGVMIEESLFWDNQTFMKQVGIIK